VVLAVLVAAVLPTFTPAPAWADSPIQPGNRPTAVPNRENGKLPDSDLINVAPECRAYRAAGPSMGLLLALARDSGTFVGTAQCYRPLTEQVEVRQQATANGNASCASSVGGTSAQPVGHSMHGWGKAADLYDDEGGLTFGSPGYRAMKALAYQFGWNHPGWAEPNGSTCPEPWHWEWVGDGGTQHASSIRADSVSVLPSGSDLGYSVVTGLGGVGNHGDAIDMGSAASVPLNWLIVGAARSFDGKGTWLAASDGGVFTLGSARFFGAMGDKHLNAPIVGMAATPDGGGYWLVAQDGGIFTFGNAKFLGSMGNKHLNRPIVGMAATPDGGGYYLVASDGGIFTFGNAQFFGSMGGTRLNSPVMGIATAPLGLGYWMVAADGGIFTFGSAKFRGSMGSTRLNVPITSMAATRSGQGYWLMGGDGGIFTFGDAQFFGAG
jgi:hypothetical protein